VKLDFDTLQTLSERPGKSTACRRRPARARPCPTSFRQLPNAAPRSAPGHGLPEHDLRQYLLPAPLREKIYDYIRKDLAGEKGAKDTDEQFIYKTRKKGFGPFKKDMWNLPPMS